VGGPSYPGLGEIRAKPELSALEGTTHFKLYEKRDNIKLANVSTKRISIPTG